MDNRDFHNMIADTLICEDAKLLAGAATAMLYSGDFTDNEILHDFSMVALIEGLDPDDAFEPAIGNVVDLERID